jgi:hypothetical protein
MPSAALSGLIMKLYKDPAKFAKTAGLEVKNFKELLRKDANGALLTLPETLSKKGGMADLAPVFEEMKLDGARAASVLSVLAVISNRYGKNGKRQPGHLMKALPSSMNMESKIIPCRQAWKKRKKVSGTGLRTWRKAGAPHE